MAKITEKFNEAGLLTGVEVEETEPEMLIQALRFAACALEMAMHTDPEHITRAVVVDAAKEKIMQMVFANGGELELPRIEAELRDRGISSHSVRRAKEALKRERKIRIYARGFGKRKKYYVCAAETAER